MAEDEAVEEVAVEAVVEVAAEVATGRTIEPMRIPDVRGMVRYSALSVEARTTQTRVQITSDRGYYDDLRFTI